MTAAADPSAVDPEEAYLRTRRLAFSGAKAMATRHLLVGLLSLGGSTALIRLVGPAAWASYTVAYYLISFIDQNLAARLLGQLIRGEKEPTRAEVDSAATLMNAAGVGFLALGLALSRPIADAYGGHHLGECLVAAGACGFVYAARSTSSALLERSLEYRTIAVGDVLDQVAFYVIGLTLVGTGHGIGGIAWALALRGVPTAIWLRYRCRTPLLGRPHRDQLRKLGAFGAPWVLAGLILLMDGLVATIVLGGRHAVQLAFYMTTGTILGYGVTVAVVSQRVSLPGLAAVNREGQRFDTAMERVTAVTLASVVTMVGPIAVTAPGWLGPLLGARWHPAAQMMIVLSAGLIVAAYVNAFSYGLAALGHARDTVALHLMMTAAYFGVAFVLLPASALLACPVAYLISRLIGVPVAILAIRRRGHSIPWIAQFGRLAFGAAGIVAIGFLVYEQAWWAALLVGLLTTATWLKLVHRDLAALLRAVRQRAQSELAVTAAS